MKEKMERKKRIVIISPNKNNYKKSEDTAILKLKMKDSNKKWGSVMNPLVYKDCYFELTYKNGMYIRDEEFLTCESEAVEYLVEFFGKNDTLYLFTTGQIIPYLENEENDYRITGIKDEIIFKLSHDDYKHQEEMIIDDDFSSSFELPFMNTLENVSTDKKCNKFKKVFEKICQKKM